LEARGEAAEPAILSVDFYSALYSHLHVRLLDFLGSLSKLSDISFELSVLSILGSLLNVIGAQSSCLDLGPAHGCKELGATIDFHKAFSRFCLYIDLVVFGHPSLLSLGIVVFPGLNAMSL